MSPPPKPDTAAADTLVSVTAEGPRTASMLPLLGAGPFANDTVAASACGISVIPAALRPTAAAIPNNFGTVFPVSLSPL
ncbi:hypothetical protein [Actinoplanes sandaracinus]|uniref:hypothetical protein n=1 Tax=Actinoplanes sandaracinus TaxID=3045177 RepID=UPI0024A85B9B|nr:hypothetical protein [Actinoplanes sandaracinus]